MEAENQFLTAFQQMLNTKPKLLKDSERKELEELIISLPNDATELAEAIASWCTAHSEINHALKQILGDLFTPENSGEITGMVSNSELQEENNLRGTLINNIRQSSRLSQSID